jgi:hypothetical protein
LAESFHYLRNGGGESEEKKKKRKRKKKMKKKTKRIKASQISLSEKLSL